jgi:hypothetical protein
MSFSSSAQIAAIAAALLWPFGASLTLVLWSKARAVRRQRQIAALEGGLKGMFHAVEAQGVPSNLAFVVEALEEGEALRPARKPTRAAAH